MPAFKTIPYRRSLRKTVLILGTLLGFVMLNLLSERLLNSNVVSAASHKQDATAIIAVDATQQLGCQIGDLTKDPHPCPNGTIIQNRYIALSQAKMLKIPYIRLTNQPDSSSWEAVYSMMRKKSQALLSLSKMVQKSTLPHYSCGTRVSPTINWEDGFGAHYTSRVDYYVGGSQCNQVYIEKAYMSESGDNTVGYGHWCYDSYAGTQYTVPEAPYLSPGSYSHDIDRYNSAGYYYQTWLLQYQCFGEGSYVNLGPLV